MSDANKSDAEKATQQAAGMMHEASEIMHEVAHEVVEDATSMVRQLRKNVNPMDTTSLFLVFGVTIVALILGSFLWNSVVGRTQTYTDATGLKITYPGNWALSDTGVATNSAGTIVVRSDVRSGGTSTLFQIDRVTVDASAPATTTLGLVANDRATTNGRALNAFRVLLSTGFTGSGADKKPLEINGLPGYKLEYVYVDSPTNALSGNIPKVIIGDDWLVRKGDKVYIFSLHSTEADRDAALPLFQSFVDSAQLP